MSTYIIYLNIFYLVFQGLSWNYMTRKALKKERSSKFIGLGGNANSSVGIYKNSRSEI